MFCVKCFWIFQVRAAAVGTEGIASDESCPPGFRNRRKFLSWGPEREVSPSHARTKSISSDRMTSLFDPITVRSVAFRNRVGVSPMCQYSSQDGFVTDWHLVHLGARAVGGAGLIIAEATAVESRGRITPHCAGLWKDEQIEPLRRITKFIKQQGAVAGIQLAHAGRKASASRPSEGDCLLREEAGGWEPWGPSPKAFGANLPRVPHEMTIEEIHAATRHFSEATERANEAGYQLVELHAAHGYLAHSFLSPLSNLRTDEYGGTFENRVRFTLETARAIRAAWPENLPMAVRLSCTDWMDGGWTIGDSVKLSQLLKNEGVDFIDCSSGALVPDAQIPFSPGFQVPFAEQIRRESGIATMAVGGITTPQMANDIIADGRADFVLLGRESLRDPHWPARAAKELTGCHFSNLLPIQYARV